MRWLVQGAITIIEIDRDGNGAAESAIELTGAKTLVAADFIL